MSIVKAIGSIVDEPRAMADTLVILPGLLCDSRMFGAQLSEFGGIAIDGFYGRADTIEAMAEYALIRMPERCALLGHSMGARVAIEICRRAPVRVTRLALADTGVHPVTEGEADKRFALRDLARRDGDAALADAWLPPMIGPRSREDPELLASLRSMVVDAGRATFEPQVNALLNRPDAATALPGISCPTVVIVGSDDSWSPPAQHERIARAIAGARLEVLEGAGHMAPAEDPIGFNRILREWLSWPSKSC